VKDQVIVETYSADQARSLAAKKLKIQIADIELQVLRPGSDGILNIGRRPTRYLARRRRQQSKQDERIAAALAIGEELDGDFVIEYDQGHAMLTVIAPGARGLAVTGEKVRERLQVLQISENDIDDVALANAVRAATGRPIAVARWSGGEKLDADFTVTVAETKLEVHVQIYPPRRGGRMVTAEEIMAEVRKRGITFGLRPENIVNYLELGDFTLPVLVAAGAEPIPGTDAQINYKFNPAPQVELKEDAKGRVDYRELGLIQSVEAGGVLAEKEPAEPGRAGVDVFGNELPATNGRDVFLRPGRNTEMSSDGMVLRALIAGGVNLAQEMVNVDAVYQVNGDVSLATGNIDFAGTVEVRGRIPDGFQVKAQGDIIVGRTVESAFLEAGGNIFVRGGALGRGGGLLKAGGDIVVKFAESANLQADGDIVSGELIMHSHTLCGGNLRLVGRRAAIIGGDHIVGGMVYCKELGAVGGSRTTVKVGVPPRVLQELTKLELLRQQLQEKQKRVEMAIQTIEREQEAGKQEEHHQTQLKQLTKLKKDIETRDESLVREKEKLQNFSECDPRAAIHVADRAYKGVALAIGPARLTLKDEFRFTTFHNRKGRVAATTFAGSKMAQEDPRNKPTGRRKKKKTIPVEEIVPSSGKHDD